MGSQLSPEDLALVDRLAGEALALARGERAAAVRRGAGGRAHVEREVLELLDAAERLHDGFLAGPPEIPSQAGDGHSDGVSATPGRIGPYRLMDVIGAGGFGVVYRAEQDPPLHRTVAIKILRAPRDAHGLLDRFEAERRALALMDHPGIARVFDAGTTPDGRPYVVMELVDGPPITRFADDRRLTIRERVDLLARVADAVQHAHAKSVIHRDLKPGNILVRDVGRAGVPLVIDFGIAKILDTDPGAPTPVTGTGQVLGTIDYMSPEQRAGDAGRVDTRTDVYALGVVLHELVAGIRPVPDQVPSAGIRRLRTDALQLAERVGRDRRLSPAQLERELRSDLDWISLRALAQDPDRRYPTPDALAADLRRYLARAPVEARRPSLLYSARAFVRRNPALVAVSALAVGALVAGTAGTTAFALRERAMRERADRESATASAIAEVLQQDVIRAGNPMATPDPALTVLEALRRIASALPTRFPERPLVRASVHLAVSESLRGFGDYDGALQQALAAVELRRAGLGERHADTLMARNHAAILLKDAGRTDEAVSELSGLLPAFVGVLGRTDEQTLRVMNNLGSALHAGARHDQAIAVLREVVRIRSEELRQPESDLAVPLNSLGVALRAAGRAGEAVAVLERSVAAREAAFGTDHPQTLTAVGNLASALDEAGRGAEAIVLHRRVFEARSRTLGPDHDLSLNAGSRLVVGLLKVGRPDEAEPVALDVLRRRAATLPADAEPCLNAVVNLVLVRLAQRRYEEALALVDEALPQVRSERWRGSTLHGILLSNRGDAVRGLGRREEALSLYGEAETILVSALGAQHPRVARVQRRRAELEAEAHDGTHVEAP